MDIKQQLGKRIQEYRKLRAITQEKLAEIVGIDTVSLSKIETGRNYPSPDNLSKLAKGLNVEVYELFVQDGIKSNEELLKEIHNEIEKISTDNKKLHILYSSIKSIVLS